MQFIEENPILSVLHRFLTIPLLILALDILIDPKSKTY